MEIKTMPVPLAHCKPSTLAAIAADMAEMLNEHVDKQEIKQEDRDQIEAIIEACFDIERGNNGAAAFIMAVMKQ